MQFVILFLLGNATFSHGQTEKKNDTLVDWSYQELLSEYDRYSNESNIRALKYCKAYLKKAKNEKDTIRIAHAFTQIITISDKEIALKYCDSIIQYTMKNPSKEYPGWGYLYKGAFLFAEGKYNDAINNASKAYRYAIINNNENHLFYLNQEIGQLKLFWGDSEDAINIYRNQLKTVSSNNSLSSSNKLSLFFSIANAFIVQKNIDSSTYYNNKGLDFSFKENKNYYPYFLSQSGEIYFLRENLKQAKDSLLKTINLKQNNMSLENTYSLLGQIELKLNDSLASLNYFRKADSIVDIHQDITPETKVIHSFLKDYYLAKGDRKNYKIYAEKLNKTDSALTENYKLVNRKLIEDFEIPKLLIEKNDAFGTVEEKETPWIFKNRTLFIFATTILIGAFVYIKRKQYLERKKLDPLKGMNPDLVRRLMKQLDNFEKKKTFSNKKYNLKTISEKFQTNSSYLSKVINAKKGKNVSSYLSDLRINHCLKELNSNKIYQNYDVKSLAIEFGFNNAESFTKAFSSRTGSTPAAYIQQLKS